MRQSARRQSVNLSVRIRRFASEHGIVVGFEKLKESIKENIEKHRQSTAERGRKFKKPNFLFAFRSDRSLEDELDTYCESDASNGKK